MNGIIIIDKQQDWTSHDVVAKLRGMLHERKIGHGGTLDPMATGVLPVFVGRATKGVEFFDKREKEYIAGIRFGLSSDTQDIWGETHETGAAQPTREAVEAVLELFRGDIMQLPPMYSAVKVDGKKLYQLARRGLEVERKPRPVTIHELELMDGENGEYRLRVLCSAGTYVRALCHDIGERLGCGAVMSSLCRTRAGDYGLEQAVTLEELALRLETSTAEELFLPLDSLFARYPAVTADAAEERKIYCGAAYKSLLEAGKYRVYGSDGSFLMLGECLNGTMHSVKNFFEVKR